MLHAVIQVPADGDSAIIDSWLLGSPGLQHLVSRWRIVWEDFYGPALDVMYMTSAHIPLARAQSMVPSLCKGNWKSSPWQGGHFLASLRGNHKPWWPAGQSVTASRLILMCGGVEIHWSRASRLDENIVPTLPCPILSAMELWMDLLLGGHAFQHHGVSQSPARMGGKHRESQDAALFPWGSTHQGVVGDESGTEGDRPWGTVIKT